MKTIKKYLMEVDVKKLISEYLLKHPIELNKIVSKKMSVEEIEKSAKKKLRDYIMRLQDLEIDKSEDKKEYVLLAHKFLEDGFEKATYSLFCVNEIIEEGEFAKSYAYEYTRQAEIVGFLVAETKYTQDNIYGLLVDALWEASFFGLEQEYLEEQKRELEDAIRECGTDDGEYTELMFEEWETEKATRDEMAEALRKQAIDAQQRYNEYQRKRAISELREKLVN